MIPGLVLFLLVMFMAEGILWAGEQRRRLRVELDYWQARRHRPDLYDWAKELDL